MPLIVQATIKNRILSALPPAELAMLSSRLALVTMELGQTLHRHGDVIEHVHFVETGFISALTVLSDGQPLEIGLIGSEGVAGFSIVLGGKTSYAETMCQTEGRAYRISAEGLKDAVANAPVLRDLMLRYALLFQIQVAQTAACNAHHALEQRLARWLLSAHDRSSIAELSLTQDLIAVMLGVRRATVSIAASTLQRAGVIRYQHGKITIVDRVGLEDAACECYEAVSGEYRRLFGEYAPPPRIVLLFERPHCLQFRLAGLQTRQGARLFAGESTSVPIFPLRQRRVCAVMEKGRWQKKQRPVNRQLTQRTGQTGTRQRSATCLWKSGNFATS